MKPLLTLKAKSSSVSDKLSFICPLCDWLGKYRGRPPKFEASEVDGEGRPWYACAVCTHAKFEERSELMAHMRATHDSERPFHCKLCGLYFKQGSSGS